MATYPENLNQDAGTIRTPAVYDSVIKQWLMLSQMLVLNNAGQVTKAQFDAFNRFAATVYATDGAIDSLGARADTAQTDPTQAATAIAILKGLLQQSLGLGKDETLQTIQSAIGVLNLTDFATGARQDLAKQVLDAISTAVAAGATEATLGLIKTALTDGTLKAQLSGSYVANAFQVSPSDAADLAYATVALYLGTGGDVKVTLTGEDTVTLKSLPGGVFYPIHATRVWSTGTSAAEIVGVY